MVAHMFCPPLRRPAQDTIRKKSIAVRSLFSTVTAVWTRDAYARKVMGLGSDAYLLLPSHVTLRTVSSSVELG